MPSVEHWPNLLAARPFMAVGVATTWATSELHTGGFEMIKFIGPLTAVFLIFLLVQSMTYLHDAEIAVAREAGNIVQLDRSLSLASEPLRSEAHLLLASYTSALFDKEWPAMRYGRDSPEVDAILARLQDVVASLPAEVDRGATARVLSGLKVVEDDRANRNGASRAALPSPLWWRTAARFRLFVLSASCMRRDDRVTMTLPLYAAGLALLAALLFMTDAPYQGALAVSSRSLQSALLSIGIRSMSPRTGAAASEAPAGLPGHDHGQLSTPRPGFLAEDHASWTGQR